jgi:hypothetical protein
MAITNTILDEYRLAYEQSNMDQFENRLSTYGAFMAYKNDSEFLIPGYKELQDAYQETRVVSLIVMNRQTLTSTATRHCAQGTIAPTSTYVTPTWTTIEVDFSMVPSQHKGNYLSYANVFNQQLKTVERTFLTALDTAAVASLAANKSTVNAADGNPYTVAAGSMVVPSSDNDLFFNEAQAILLANDLPADSINIIGSTRLMALKNEYISQGAGNATNRAFQFGPFNFNLTPRVTNAAGDRDTLYMAPKGSLGFLSWVDQDSVLNSKSGTTEWSVQFLPRLGFNVGMMEIKNCADNHTRTGTATTASLLESFMFSFDYSFITSYDSGSGIGSSIFKANFTKM